MVARHLKRGRVGEDIARAFLLEHGYEVLDANWRSRHGELDLICSKKGLVVFVEVKTRQKNARELPGEALTPKKRQRLVKAAGAYLTKNRLWERRCRIDLVSITLDTHHCQLEHVENAVEYSEAPGGGHTHWQPW
jgi:putative endonuclease